MEALIACPAGLVPSVGKYLLAADREETDAALGVVSFNAETTPHGFWEAAPIPPSWRPGTALDLTGPLGHGFDLPREVQRLGLAALGESMGRLMPLVRQAAIFLLPGFIRCQSIFQLVCNHKLIHIAFASGMIES